MNPLIRSPTGAPMLVCPNCSDRHPLAGIHTHITAVTVHARQEDQDGTRIVIDPRTANDITITPEQGPDMPGRRDAVTLQVWFEECDAVTDIQFLQVKGSTYVTSRADL